MKSPLVNTLEFIPVLLFLLSASALATELLQGSWQCQGNDGMHSLKFQSNSTLVCDGTASGYAILPNAILVQGDDGISSYGYHLDGNKLAVSSPNKA